jgi:hypothetical protein
MKFKNLILGIKYQLPLSRLFRNFFITGNGWGMFSKNSHINQHTKTPKITYNHYETAVRSAQIMSEKQENIFLYINVFTVMVFI